MLASTMISFKCMRLGDAFFFVFPDLSYHPRCLGGGTGSLLLILVGAGVTVLSFM